MIRSTDSDLLFIFLAVWQQFAAVDIQIIIHYNTPGSHFRKYVDGNKLISELENDPGADMSMLRNCVSLPHVLSVLHYMTGSDEISHMRGFTKLHCIKTLLKYGSFIFGNDIEVTDLLQPANLQSLIV